MQLSAQSVGPEVTSADLLAITTLVLAVATIGVATVSYRQLRLSIRPFLVDPRPAGHGEEEQLLFGAPGRISPRVVRGALYYSSEQPGAFHFSVAFENVGRGVAAILGAEVDPSVPGAVYTSRSFVPVGEIVRVNVSILTEPAEAERFRDQWWARGRPAVSVRYTDSNGTQPLVTRVALKQVATQGPWVDEVAIFADRWWRRWKPVAVGRASYQRALSR